MSARRSVQASAPLPLPGPVPYPDPHDLFVGRESELAHLREALRRALEGFGRVRLLCGEPGIGKTRLAEEIAREATLAGLHELRGRCDNSGGAPPYWPWLQAVRTLLAGSTDHEFAADWGGGARVARVLFPELAPHPAEREVPRRAGGSDDLGWFRLLDALSAYLLRVSDRKPLLIVLDDLHWADQRSLDFLLHLTRRIADHPLLILATIRDDELLRNRPLARLRAELVKESTCDELHLEGLARTDVERYLEWTVGDGIPKRLSRTVHVLTDGNPLYLSQLARDPVALQGRGGPLPDGVRAAIAGRLDTLPPRTYDVLSAASLFSGSFDVQRIATVLEASAEGVMASIDEGLRAHLLRAEPDDPHRYTFVHGLVRDCLRSDLPLGRKVALHAAIARMLERSYGLDARVPAAELMAHFAAATPLLGPGKAARYSRDAARQALEQDAWEDCIRYAEAGIEALEGQPMDDLKAEMMTVRFTALNWASALLLPYEASGPLAAAFEQYERSGNAPLAMELICRMGAWLVARYGPSFRERGLRFAPGSGTDAARVIYILGLGLGNFLDDYAGANGAFREALEIAEGCADRELQGWVLWFRAGVERNHLRPEESVRTAFREIELAAEHGKPRLENLARLQLAAWLAPLGRVDEAHAQARRALEIAEDLEERHLLLSARARSAWLAYHDGDLEEALRLAELWLADAPPIGSYWYDPRHLRLCVEYERGHFEAGRRHLAELLDWVREARPGWEAQARERGGTSIVQAALFSGDTSELATLRRWAGSVPAIPANPYSAQSRMSTRSHLALLSGDRDLAAEQYAALCGRRIAPDLPRLLVAQGALARMLGKLDDAVDLLRPARAAVRWSVPTHVQCGYELASTLRARGGAADRREARVVWAEALELAERHGLAPWVDRIRGGMRELEERTARRPHERHPDGLTLREVQILRLVASGRSNKAIAGELKISERTVDHHVGSILAKTGAANRTEAAGYAHRRGLG